MSGVSISIASWSALVVFVATSTAAAQSAAPGVKAEGPPPLEDTGCVSSERERTSELFGRATAAWEKGDTAGAVAAMREAHAVSKCSAFLFVLGEMLSQSEHECDALAWYERYVGDNPAVERRSLAMQRISELRGRCPASASNAEVSGSVPVENGSAQLLPAAPSAPSAPSTPPPPRAESTPRTPRSPTSVERARGPEARGYWSPGRIGGWAALGASALLSSGAIYFAVRAQNASNDYEELWKSLVSDPSHGEAWQRRRAELEQRGASSESTARILGGAAGALAVGGALLLLIDPSARSTHEVTVSAQPSAMMARYGVRF